MNKPEPIPADSAGTADMVAFFRRNDPNGNWPELAAAATTYMHKRGMEWTPQPADLSFCWYDYEMDCWLTDAMVRAQLLPILAAWREDAIADDHHSREGRPNWRA